MYNSVGFSTFTGTVQSLPEWILERLHHAKKKPYTF